MVYCCFSGGGKSREAERARRRKEPGGGKHREAESTGRRNRGGFGSMNYRTDKYGDVAAVKVVYDDDDAIFITESGIMIRVSCADIRECARPSKGVKVMKLNEGDRIITMTTAKKSEEDEKAEPLPEDPEDNTAEENEEISEEMTGPDAENSEI